MTSDKSLVIIELAELFELVSSIGTSLDLTKNAQTFFAGIVQRKNLNHISVWQREEDTLHIKEFFPKIQGMQDTIGHHSPLCSHFNALPEGVLHFIQEDQNCLQSFKSDNLWVFFYRDIYIICIQNEVENIFQKREQSQLANLFKKFCISIKASLAHQALIDEIDKRKKTEEKLFERESLFRLGANSLKEGIIGTDLDNKITYVNPAMEQITGYTQEELYGAIAYKLLKPVGMHNFMGDVVEQKRKKGISEIYEVQLVHKNGTLYWVRVNASPFMNSEGVVIGMIASVLDFTKRIEMENQKEKLVAELEEANQELKDFAYVVSHDLKAPLRGIGSLSDWLIEDYGQFLDDQGVGLLNLLKSRIKRMHLLIEGVLQYSKVGRLRSKKEQVDVHQLLVEIIDILVPPKSCTISIESTMPSIWYDRIRIQQVFQNLISNAIKFMDKPNGEITIGVKDLGDHFAFSVEDNGPGIEPEYHKKIFNIFQTLQAKDDYESSGIGLSIVKRIVELNGGKVTVESQVSEGCKFTFTVPKEKKQC